MEVKELYPELLNYIFSYCGRYFWETEKIADRHFLAMLKSKQGVNETMYKFFMKEQNVYANKEIMDLISEGFDKYKIKVVTRIWSEHKHELELNLCPKCGKIARTPWAKQCRFCFHDWH
jgi:ribosomal protein L40E